MSTASAIRYTSICPSCREENSVDPSKFDLAAQKIRCRQCRTIFDAKRHRSSAVNNNVASRGSSQKIAEAVQKNKIAILSRRIAPSSKGKEKGKITRYHSVIYPCAVFLLLSAISQLAYFNRVSWSQMASLQPLYSYMSPWIPSGGWQLQQIEQLSLKVQPHHEYNDSLKIGFEIINRGGLAVSAPDVTLIFSDLQGRISAQRRFHAQDYSTISSYPVTLSANDKIHGEISILQPANRALNYQLTLSPASTH